MSLSTQPYRGTRDFYPSDFAKRQYIFDTWRKTLKRLGYEEYDASIIENAELYIKKSGEELGSKQLYSFQDKGGRNIALRPEWTPTLARLVSQKFGELKFPLKWFCIPNCFRYERPQKGRVREFWQLNFDIIGVEPGGSDLEMLYGLGELFLDFGATKEQFKIMFNHRQVLDTWLEQNDLFTQKTLIYEVLDDWFKLSLAENEAKLCETLDVGQIKKIVDLTQKTGQAWSDYLEIANSYPEMRLIQENLTKISPNVEWDFAPTIIRGIAYYTGLVFEAFDKNPENNRAMFGGGRYDDLLSLFDKEAKAVGVGVGDVTWWNFLDNWNLWPQNLGQTLEKVGLMPKSENDLIKIYTEIIPELQKQNKPFEIDYNYTRNENKRYEFLKKRGCINVIKY